MSCSHLYNSPHAQRTQLNQVFTKAILMRDLLCSLASSGVSEENRGLTYVLCIATG